MRQQHPSSLNEDHNGVYAFDLKLNVDFNTRHLSLNIPNQVPFSKKVYVPLSNYPTSVVSTQVPQYIPIHHQQIPQSMPQIPSRNLLIHNSHQQEVQRQSLQNHKNVESMNTTSFRLQPSPQSIQCVICEKIIRSQQFSLHLEEHRNKKKDKSRGSIKESDVSVRDKNSEAEFVELMHQQPHSTSLIPNSLNFSKSSQAYSQPYVTANNEMLPNIKIQAQNPQMVYFQHSQSQIINHPIQQNSFSQTSFNLTHSITGKQQYINGSSISNSFSRMPTPIPEPSNHFNSFSQRQIILHDPSPIQIPPERDFNGLHFHRIQSMIIRPEPMPFKVDKGFDDCGQSMISRNSIPTKYSQIYALEHELQDKRRHFSEQESSSSDDESLNVIPSKSYRSGITPPQNGLQRSTYTEKLSKTKLPVNYLARQEFITTSTHHSNSRNSKGMS